MDENILDLRGRPSPEPLVEARRLIGAGEIKSFVVLLTDARCVENLALLAASVGWSSRVERTTEGDLRVAMRARRASPAAISTSPPKIDQPRAATPAELPSPVVQTVARARTVVLIASLRVGEGAPGEQLLKDFVLALPRTPLPPDAVVLLNDGATLIEETSGVAAALESLAHGGTAILVGASCAERLGLTSHLRFAKTVSMPELAALLLATDRVVRL